MTAASPVVAQVALVRSRWREALRFLADAYSRYRAHRGDLLASGLAYRALLSLAPLLVVAQALLSAWLGERAARTSLLDPIADALGRRAAHVVGAWLDAARQYTAAATVVGIALFLIGATRLVTALDDVLALVLETRTPDQKWNHELLGWLRTQGRAVAVTAALVVAIGACAALEAWLTGVLAPWSRSGGGEVVLRVVQLCVLAAWTFPTLAAVYGFLPVGHMTPRDVGIASCVTGAVLIAGTSLLWLYFRLVDVGASYGATGAVVAVLLWLFYVAQALVLGAELAATSHARRRKRAPRRPSAGATAVATARTH